MLLYKAIPMKTILPIWCLLCLLCSTNLLSQASCDSTIAGITTNMSINANCRLDIDTTVARMLLSNPYPDLTYNAKVFDSTGDSMISNILTEDHIGQTFMIAITGSGCATGSGSGSMFGAWSTLTLEDKINPVITCLDTIISCVELKRMLKRKGYTKSSENCSSSSESNCLRGWP